MKLIHSSCAKIVGLQGICFNLFSNPFRKTTPNGTLKLSKTLPYDGLYEN